MKRFFLSLTLATAAAFAVAQPKKTVTTTTTTTKSGKSEILVIKNGDTTRVIMPDLNTAMKDFTTTISENAPRVESIDTTINGKRIQKVTVISKSDTSVVDLTKLAEEFSNAGTAVGKELDKTIKVIQMTVDSSFKGDNKVIIMKKSTTGNFNTDGATDGPLIISPSLGGDNIEMITINSSEMIVNIDSTDDDPHLLLVKGKDTTALNFGGKEKGKKAPSCSSISTSTTVLDLGFNNWLYANNSISPTAGYENFRLNGGKSIGVNIAKLYSYNLVHQKLRIQTGIGIESNNYKFSNNIALNVTGDTLSAVPMNDCSKMRKYKLNPTYAYVPLMLEFRSKPKDEEHSFNIAVGAEASYLIAAKTKRVYNDANGDYNKEKLRNDFLLNDYKFSAIARVGYGDLDFFVRYGLTNLFRSNAVAPEVRPIMIGLTFGGF